MSATLKKYKTFKGQDISKFGKKTRELFKAVEENPDWRKYVTPGSISVIESILRTKNITESMAELDMKYTTLRAHLLSSCERIKHHRTDFFRYGRSSQAKELFNLMDVVPNWRDYVTEHEADLALTYRDVKNFYRAAEILGVKASNIAAALYGNTQKIGVVGKLKRALQNEKE